LKGPKKEMRKNADGFEYNYSEGGMIFPDPLDKPSRTIITGEGGKSASRFKHVIQTPKGFRRLSPVELERLNMFPDDHTKLNGISDTKRAFFMGNALVVGVIEKIGIALTEKIKNEVTV
jgi:DNA (cytosine-5)-methyltransferase 1